MLDMDSAHQYEQNEVLHDYVDPFIKIFMCRRGGVERPNFAVAILGL